MSRARLTRPRLARLCLAGLAMLLAGSAAANPVAGAAPSGASSVAPGAAPSVAPVGPPGAGPAASDAAALLFERAQLAATTPGETLAYRYARKASDAELGASFDDHITLKVEARAEGGPKEARDVSVDFFSGERHRAAGPFAGITGNPVLILFLENHVRDLATRLNGNPRYFKSAIRAALRDKAEVTPAAVQVGDATHQGWRITVRPFAGDANAKRMRGLDGLTYAFEVAPDVPGEIAAIKITADAPAGRLLEEELTYDPKGS